MNLKTRIRALLMSREAMQIRFTVPSASVPITINHETFSRVAVAILFQQIAVVRYVTNIGHNLAMYGQPVHPTVHSSGELLVPPTMGPRDAAGVLAACVSAFFDLTRAKVLATEEIALGHIVAALYYKVAGLPETGAYKSDKVADSVVGQYGFPWTPVVDASEFRDVMIAVALAPRFINSSAGLFPRHHGKSDSYTHDG